MIEKFIAANLGHGDTAILSESGVFTLCIDGHETYMTESQARRLWSNLGTMFRESAKWNG